MITEILSPNIEIVWLPWAVAYFFFIGISFSSVVLTLPAVVFGQKQQLGVARVSLLVMLICAIVGPVALLADIHQPARFWHFYAHITPWSWMSIGAIFLPAYVMATLVYSWLFLRPALLENKTRPGLSGVISRILGMGTWQGQQLLKPVAIITVFLAMVIALYTGAEVAIVAARVLWSSYLIPVFFLITALLGASSLALLIAYIIHEDKHTMAYLMRYNRWFALASLLLIGLWFMLAVLGNGAEANTLKLVKNSAHWQLNFAMLLLLLVASVMPTKLPTRLSPLSVMAGAMAGLLVSWYSRWLIFIDGQSIPKYAAGFYSYDLPSGTEGLLGMIGVFGLCLFLSIILYEYLPWHNRKDSQQ